MRPIKYKKTYCKKLIDHMAKGFSFESFAATIGCCRRTLYNWADPKHKSFQKEFLHAKKEGTEKCMLFFEQAGHLLMMGKKKGSAAVWVFNMKNRFNWTDRVEDATEKENADLNVNINFKKADIE